MKPFFYAALVLLALSGGVSASTTHRVEIIHWSVYFSPNQGALEALVNTINEAKHEVLVAAYSFTNPKIAQALLSAKRRGCTVMVVADKRGNETHYMACGWLAKNGVPVRLNDKYAIMHDKFVLIDGTTLETGSFNFTGSAESRNSENMLILKCSQSLVKAYKRHWIQLWKEGK